MHWTACVRTLADGDDSMPGYLFTRMQRACMCVCVSVCARVCVCVWVFSSHDGVLGLNALPGRQPDVARDPTHMRACYINWFRSNTEREMVNETQRTKTCKKDVYWAAAVHAAHCKIACIAYACVFLYVCLSFLLLSTDCLPACLRICLLSGVHKHLYYDLRRRWWSWVSRLVRGHRIHLHVKHTYIDSCGRWCTATPSTNSESRWRGGKPQRKKVALFDSPNIQIN